MSFWKATAKFVFVHLMNLLMWIIIGITKCSFKIVLQLVKHAIKQVIWYFAIFLKYAIFQIIKFIYMALTCWNNNNNNDVAARKPRRKALVCKTPSRKQLYYLDVMTDDETDDETDYETDDD